MRAFALLFFLLASFAAFAKEESPFPKFNSSSMTEFKGKILSVQKISLVNEPQQTHIQLIVRFKQADMSVELGPEWYLKENGMILMPSDIVEVKGSLVKLKGKYLVIATEVKTENDELRLRDDKGNPIWLSK